MSIETFVARALRAISVPVVIVALFLSYYSLPERVAVHFDPSGKTDGTLGRESVFYAAAGIVLIFNLLFSLLARSVARLPAVAVAVGVFGTHSWRQNPADLRQTLVNWLLLGAAGLNAFLVPCFDALSELNDAQPNETVFDYRYLLPLGAALLAAWLLYLPGRFWLTKPMLNE